MRTKIFGKLMMLAIIAGLFTACQKNDVVNPAETNSISDSQLKAGNPAHGYVHGIIVEIDGVEYYLDGPPDGPNGEKDAPGHYWVQAGPNQLNGKHYNTGPFGMAQWWSSDAADGALLYMVHAKIDEWTVAKANNYASRGYVHYHEFVTVENPPTHHPTKVIWLKHTAVTSFTLDGGPGGQGPNPPPYLHAVTPGVDYEFPNNYGMPYAP